MSEGVYIRYMTERARNATQPAEKKTSQGAIAQLGERLPCTQEVGGSIPPGSTNFTRTLLHQTQYFVESYDGSMLLFNNLEISDVLSGSTLREASAF